MFDAFSRLGQPGFRIDSATVAGGLWEASLTTAAGLAVGVPAFAVLYWLERRADRLFKELESAAARAFAPGSAESIQNREGVSPGRIPGTATFAGLRP